MVLSKNQSEQVKGVAVLLMIAHHLYAFPDRVPLMMAGDSFWERNLLYNIGAFGQLCVSLFLFISGYGLGLGNPASLAGSVLRRLRVFMTAYWLNCIFIFIIGRIFLGPFTAHVGAANIGYDWSFSGLLGNLSLWDISYNREWWFARLYVIILVLIWPMCEVLSRRGMVLLMACSWFLFGLSSVVNEPVRFLHHQLAFVVGFWMSRYNVGIIDDSAKLFGTKYSALLESIFCLALSVLIKKKLKGELDALAAPIFVHGFLGLIRMGLVGSMLSIVGRNSIYMWLNHTFLFYYFWGDFFYSINNSIIRYFLIVILSFLAACLCSGVIRVLSRKKLLCA
jgi:hypothetical protein